MFESCRIKIARAQEVLEDLARRVDMYLSRVPFSAIREMTGTPQEYVIRAHIKEYPDPALGTLTGEVVHHLRSALDYAVGELIQLGTGHLPTVTDRFEFPVFCDAHAFRRARAKFAGVPASAAAAIENMQPFQSNNPEITSIWLLHRVNIADKHRSLHVVAAASLVTNISRTEVPNATPIVVPPQWQVPAAVDLTDGAEVFRYNLADPSADAPRIDVRMGLVFSQPAEVRGHSLFTLLRFLMSQTEIFLDTLATSVGSQYTKVLRENAELHRDS